MPRVVDELVWLREFKAKVPYHDERRGTNGEVNCVVPMWMLRQTVLADLDESKCAEHSKVDDPEVEIDAEGPFLCRPMDGAEISEEIKDGFEQPGLAHEPGNEGHRGEELEHEERGAIVKLRSNGHRRVDDQIPHGYERREIVRNVIGVHGVREQESEQIQPHHDLR